MGTEVLTDSCSGFGSPPEILIAGVQDASDPPLPASEIPAPKLESSWMSDRGSSDGWNDGEMEGGMDGRMHG